MADRGSGSGSASVHSFPPPRPKSPPDLYGRRKEMARLQMVEREKSYLEEELKFVEGLQPASRCCKETVDFVTANGDPLIKTNHNISKSCQLWKWLCGSSCLNLSWMCCCTGCTAHLKALKCCCCNLKQCNPCTSCPLPDYSCWYNPCPCCCVNPCNKSCCSFNTFPCKNCCSCKCKCSCPKCPSCSELCSCFSCIRNCCCCCNNCFTCC